MPTATTIKNLKKNIEFAYGETHTLFTGHCYTKKITKYVLYFPYFQTEKKSFFLLFFQKAYCLCLKGTRQVCCQKPQDFWRN